MKRYITLLLCLTLIVSCGITKKYNEDLTGNIQYNEALKAIQKKMFRIEAIEVYEGYYHNEIIDANGCWIEVHDTVANVRLLPPFWSNVDNFNNHSIEYGSLKIKNNGNCEFSLRFNKNEGIKDIELQITLYNNSDLCLTIIKSGYALHCEQRFKGRIVPLYD